MTKLIYKNIFYTLVSLSVVLALSSCGKNKTSTTTDTDDSEGVENLAQQVLSESSSHASATEGSTVGLSSYESSQATSQLSDISQMTTACSYSSPYKTCSSATGTIDWNSCSISYSGVNIATMTGGWNEDWTSASECQHSYLSDGGSVVRSASRSTITFTLGRKTITDTTGGTAYDGTVFTSGGIRTTRATLNRSVSMTTGSAIHRTGISRKGITYFDYYMVPSLTVSGSLKNSSSNTLTGNRTIGGSLTVYHNLLKYTATSQFNSVIWTDSSCCYPTSGNIAFTFTGTNKPANSATMTFSASCGTATLTTVSDSGSSTSSMTLENCE